MDTVGAGGDGALRGVSLLTASAFSSISTPSPVPLSPTHSSPTVPIAPSIPNVVVRADVRAKPEENARSGTPASPNRIGREIGLEAVDADAEYATTTSSTAPTASATSHLLGFRVDVPAELEANIDPGTPTRQARTSSPSSELSSPFAQFMIARGSTMRSMMATPMGKPCPGPHTPGASAHETAGGRKVSHGGVRGEAAVQRVASCTVDECLSAIRTSPPHPSGCIIGIVHHQRVSPLIRITSTVLAIAPRG